MTQGWKPLYVSLLFLFTVANTGCAEILRQFVGGSFTAPVAGPDLSSPTALKPIELPCYNFGGASSEMFQLGNTLYLGGPFNGVDPLCAQGFALSISTAQVLNPNTMAKIPYDSINTVIADGTGGWFIGGSFISVGDFETNGVARIKADGTLDESLKIPNPFLGFNDQVKSLFYQNGILYFGGQFEMQISANSSIYNLAAWNLATNSLASWFPATPNDDVYAIAASGDDLIVSGEFSRLGVSYTDGALVHAGTGATEKTIQLSDNGQIYTAVSDGAGGMFIAGEFTSVNGVTVQNMAHILANDTVDANWLPNPDAIVFHMRSDAGILYIAGSFQNAGGAARSGLAAINAVTGLATNWNPGPNASVQALEVSAGVIYIGGNFTTVGGASRAGLAAIDATTGLATGWDPNPDAFANHIQVGGGFVYVAGNFSSIGGQARTFLAALDPATGLADPGWAPAPTGTVMGMKYSGGLLYAFGSFGNIGGQNRAGLAAVDGVTGLATFWNPTPNAMLTSLTVSGGVVYVSGDNLTSIDGLPSNRVEAIDAVTGFQTAWDPGLGPGSAPRVLEIDGSILLYIYSFSIGGASRNGLGSVSMTTGLVTTWNPQSDGGVYTLAVSGNQVFVSGDFSEIGLEGREKLASIDLTTGLATGWDPDPDGYVQAFALNNGILYVIGDFANIGGAARDRIAALDAVTGAATGWSPAHDGTYLSALIADDDHVYVTGDFLNIGGQSRNGMAQIGRLSGVVTSWDADTTGTVPVQSMAISGSSIYVSWPSAFEESRAGLAAIDMTTRKLKAWNPGQDGDVYSLYAVGNSVYVGGNFQNIGGAA